MITIQQIRELSPCYDPAKYLPENWEGTVIDILNIESCPIKDRFWVVLREDFIDAKTLRLFAVWCARSVPQTDERCINAINVAECFANGLATKEELSAARDAAMDAARDTAWCAARDATMDAQLAHLKTMLS